MKGEQAVEIFKLAKAGNMLPEKLEDLVPLSFIGQAAVSFYRAKIKAMDQLKMTEEQRKATLRDGQDAGEMLLDIEVRIGELAAKEPQVQPIILTAVGTKGAIAVKPSGKPPKHERLGLPSVRRMQQAETLAKHPEVVAKVKAQARANEDIPTRTATLAQISYEKEKKRREEAEKTRTKSKAIMTLDQSLYIQALDKCIRTLPQKPPVDWGEETFKEAKAKAKIIIKRLEAFS